MKFKSNAKYDKPVETGTIFKLKDNKLNISIHKILHCGDELYLDCNALDIENMPLNTDCFEEVVKKSIEIIRKRTNKILTEMFKFSDDKWKIEIDRY